MEPISEEPTVLNNSSGNANSQNSQTASDYIDAQLALEADAKEILPYKFDKCTYSQGPLRQSVFACLTCSPPPASPAQVHTPAGICYGCSISCHGEHHLVELFKRRNFTCDCGTTRMPGMSPCQLRSDATGRKGVNGQEAAKGNTYNQNYQNRFCGCGEDYDPETEKGTMYQCVGLGTVDTGGCGEDWWHPECLMGLPRDWSQKGLATVRPHKESDGDDDHPVPEGFPDDDDFSALVCYKCVESNPWIKQYAGTEGFLSPVMKRRSSTDPTSQPATNGNSLKRKASDDDSVRSSSPTKRTKEEEAAAEEKDRPSVLLSKSNTATLESEDTTLNTNPSLTAPSTIGPPSTAITAKHKHESLPRAPSGTFSILAKEAFRDNFCHCPQCFPNLIHHPQLQEEEDEYEPSVSDDATAESQVGTGTRSVGTGASLLDRGEAALNNVDRVRAIEGVMVYNHLKDKVKEFLKPYAESGQAVSAEDIKGYFEKLRGDEDAVREAGKKPGTTADAEDNDDQSGGGGDTRREQSGY